MSTIANNIATGQITLSGSAQLLVPATFTKQIKSIEISNQGATNKAYVGASGVTTGTGTVLMPGQSKSFEATDASDFYVIGTASDVLTYTVIYAGS